MKSRLRFKGYYLLLYDFSFIFLIISVITIALFSFIVGLFLASAIVTEWLVFCK